jgi:hypothetical protein
LCSQLRSGRRETNDLAAGDFDTLYRPHNTQLLRAAYAITLELEVAGEITHEGRAIRG